MRNGPISTVSRSAMELRICEGVAARHIGARRSHDGVRFLADPDRNLRADMAGEAVMVLMGMRDHDAEQAVVRLPKPRDFGQQLFLPFVEARRAASRRRARFAYPALRSRCRCRRSPWCPGGYAISPAASLQQFRPG